MSCARKHMACLGHEWEACAGPCTHPEPRQDTEQALACGPCSAGGREGLQAAWGSGFAWGWLCMVKVSPNPLIHSEAERLQPGDGFGLLSPPTLVSGESWGISGHRHPLPQLCPWPLLQESASRGHCKVPRAFPSDQGPLPAGRVLYKMNCLGCWP